jgi:hypothetical protein
MSETENKRMRREEIRGIFTLGLMAILITLRVSQHEITLEIMGQVYIFTEIIDVTLICWGIYAFAMMIWLSPEIFPKNVCDFSYMMGILFLLLSFILYYLTAFVITFTLPSYWKIVSLFLLVLPLYIAVQGIISAIKWLVKLVKRQRFAL